MRAERITKLVVVQYTGPRIALVVQNRHLQSFDTTLDLTTYTARSLSKSRTFDLSSHPVNKIRKSFSGSNPITLTSIQSISLGFGWEILQVT